MDDLDLTLMHDYDMSVNTDRIVDAINRSHQQLPSVDNTDLQLGQLETTLWQISKPRPEIPDLTGADLTDKDPTGNGLAIIIGGFILAVIVLTVLFASLELFC